MRPFFLVLIALLLTACTGTATEEPLDPVDLVTDAAENIRESDTFRMSVERSGASYFVETDLGSVDFRRAVAQYVAPELVQHAHKQTAGCALRTAARGGS